jgi:hypothetical protein
LAAIHSIKATSFRERPQGMHKSLHAAFSPKLLNGFAPNRFAYFRERFLSNMSFWKNPVQAKHCA